MDLALCKRKEFSEGKLLEESLGKRKGDGARGSAGIVLRQDCGKKLGKDGRLSF